MTNPTVIKARANLVAAYGFVSDDKCAAIESLIRAVVSEALSERGDPPGCEDAEQHYRTQNYNRVEPPPPSPTAAPETLPEVLPEGTRSVSGEDLSGYVLDSYLSRPAYYCRSKAHTATLSYIDWTTATPPAEVPAKASGGKWPSDSELSVLYCSLLGSSLKASQVERHVDALRALFEAGAASRDAEVAAYERFVDWLDGAMDWDDPNCDELNMKFMALRSELSALEGKGK